MSAYAATSATDLDRLKKQKTELLKHKADDLNARSLTNPYLKDVVQEYDALKNMQKEQNKKIANALHIIETHIKELQSGSALDADTKKKLKDDWYHVYNKLKDIQRKMK